jgi:hypothetical protein
MTENRLAGGGAAGLLSVAAAAVIEAASAGVPADTGLLAVPAAVAVAVTAGKPPKAVSLVGAAAVPAAGAVVADRNENPGADEPEGVLKFKPLKSNTGLAPADGAPTQPAAALSPPALAATPPPNPRLPKAGNEGGAAAAAVVPAVEIGLGVVAAVVLVVAGLTFCSRFCAAAMSAMEGMGGCEDLGLGLFGAVLAGAAACCVAAAAEGRGG